MALKRYGVRVPAAPPNISINHNFLILNASDIDLILFPVYKSVYKFKECNLNYFCIVSDMVFTAIRRLVWL